MAKLTRAKRTTLSVYLKSTLRANYGMPYKDIKDILENILEILNLNDTEEKETSQTTNKNKTL